MTFLIEGTPLENLLINHGIRTVTLFSDKIHVNQLDTKANVQIQLSFDDLDLIIKPLQVTNKYL